jgi:hypothetical protein
MGFFSRRQKQPTLPSDIISMMERFGRYEFNLQTSAYDGEDIGRIMAELYPFASTDPAGFLVALAEAVLPVGGWAVYGASRTVWELLNPSVEIRHHLSYNAIMNASLEFLRTSGVPSIMLNGYEEAHWLASGGTRDTWVTWSPTPGQEEAPIAKLLPDETRRVAQLTSEPDSNAVLVRQLSSSWYCALMDSMTSDKDPRRVQREWQSAGSLYELNCTSCGRLLLTPPHWYDQELGPYFPLPRRKI